MSTYRRLLDPLQGFFVGCFWAASSSAQQPAPRPETPPPPSALQKALHEDGRAARQAAYRQTQILAVVRALPPDASREVLLGRLDSVLVEMGRATKQDLPWVREAMYRLRGQPQIVRAIETSFDSSSSTYDRRLQLVELIGELRRSDALPFLQKVLAIPLPSERTSPEGLSPRVRVELLQAAAIAGVGYIRTVEGAADSNAVRSTLRVAQTHPSTIVRIAAIDAYMWNAGDSPRASAELYSALPRELHRYVERPRFQAGATVSEFRSRVEAWRARWAR